MTSLRETDAPCKSSTKCPSPTSGCPSRLITASSAARFSATNRTRRPSATLCAIRFAIVWLLPVAGLVLGAALGERGHRVDAHPEILIEHVEQHRVQLRLAGDNETHLIAGA